MRKQRRSTWAPLRRLNQLIFIVREGKSPSIQVLRVLMETFVVAVTLLHRIGTTDSVTFSCCQSWLWLHPITKTMRSIVGYEVGLDVKNSIITGNMTALLQTISIFLLRMPALLEMSKRDISKSLTMIIPRFHFRPSKDTDILPLLFHQLLFFVQPQFLSSHISLTFVKPHHTNNIKSSLHSQPSRLSAPLRANLSGACGSFSPWRQSRRKLSSSQLKALKYLAY